MAVGTRLDTIGLPDLRAFPFVQEGAFGVENLKTLIFAVADDDAAPDVHSDAMRQMELARPRSFGAPLKLEAACGGELHHARVLVTVAHIKRTIWQHRHIRGQIEMRGIVPRHSSFSQREQNLA